MQPTTTQPTAVAPPLKAYFIIFIGVLSTSAAASLIRLALGEGMPPVLIAGSRLFIATVILTPITVNRYWSNIQNLTRTEFFLATVSGTFLAIHFITWVSSLQYTTVLVSVVIVSTGPIWVAILEVIFLRVRLSRLVILGLIIALVGGVYIGISGQGGNAQLAQSVSQPDTTITGAILSLIGALAVSVYMLIGRKLRARLPVIPYIWLVYGIATAVMLVVVLITSTPIFGFSTQGYLILLAMGIIPQLIGHSSLNYALEYFPATFVSMFTQLDPVGSAILAFFIFAELPPSQQIIGSIIILSGVFLASRGKVTRSD